MVMRALIISILLLLVSRVQAQRCFARVQLDRQSVYVQQPFKVTITVLTATWFTAPVEFDNLQVPNAFVLPFDRNYPGMFEHNGKQYAGIQFHFIVFPYRAGKFTIPPIAVHVTTPPEGSSDSRPITIRTPLQHFTVNAVPGKDKDNWFVAKSVAIHEHWNKSLAHLKVGDVIERTITVTARGTLPQFIPVLKEQSLDFANVYPQDPGLKDLKDEYDANGQLTQSFIYLMEKEGNFALPPMTVRWWNPNARKMAHRSLPQHKIVVHSNPDLGMVTSIRDSLDLAQSPVAAAKTKKPFKILGMKWYVFAAYATVTLLLLYIFVRVVVKLTRRVRGRYARYRQSELYWFRHLMRATPASGEFWRRLYEWWDRIEYDEKEMGLRKAFVESGDPLAGDAMSKASEEIYEQGHAGSKAGEIIKKQLRGFRKWVTRHSAGDGKSIPERQQEWREH